MKIAFTSMIYTGDFVPYVNLMYDSLKNKLKTNFDVILFVTDNIDQYYLKQLTVPYKLVKHYSFLPRSCRDEGGDYYNGTINKFYWATLVDEYDYIIQLDADLIPTLNYSDDSILTLINKYKDSTLIATKRFETYDEYSPETGWTLTGTQYIINLNKFKHVTNFKDIVNMSIENKLYTDEQVMNSIFNMDDVSLEMKQDIHEYLISKFLNDSIVSVVNDNPYIVKYLIENSISVYNFFLFMLNILMSMSAKPKRQKSQ